MTPELVTTIGKDTVMTVLMMALPILMTGMVVGLTVSIFQSMTQIQEMTLTFVPKIILVLASLLVFGPWMLHIYLDFFTNLITNIPTYIG